MILTGDKYSGKMSIDERDSNREHARTDKPPHKKRHIVVGLLGILARAETFAKGC